MTDMQQNFDAQLAGKENEMSSRLDNMSQKQESELSGALMRIAWFFSSFARVI